jgi:hypothetical protein
MSGLTDKERFEEYERQGLDTIDEYLLAPAEKVAEVIDLGEKVIFQGKMEEPIEKAREQIESVLKEPTTQPEPTSFSFTEEDKIHDQQASDTPNKLPHNRAEHIGGSHYEPDASKYNISVYVNPKRKRTVISYGEPETSMYDNLNEMRRQFLSSQADAVYNYLNQEADYLHDHTFIHQGTGKVSEEVASKYRKRKIGIKSN